ncbi:hypothetical protein H6P81_002785 [Aristolochia fimbriata]|uniref:SNARE-complex protein Syntaxin-18 N-terminal domain-containing protein n=1 Tax=Aristolochia fimbriata TaxID=158543 RepID=A0AAV7FDZ0_ARIFI|nr:hypothetical protein H6P81_002785 [Aristolochia fimbriata]
MLSRVKSESFCRRASGCNPRLQFQFDKVLRPLTLNDLRIGDSTLSTLAHSCIILVKRKPHLSNLMVSWMAKCKDRSEDFKDSVRSAAVSLDYSESKVAAIMASMIICKPKQKLPFTKAALKTLQSINELEFFIMKHRKDYVDPHRTTEQERDSIEHEVSVFIKACKEQVEILTNRIHDEEKTGNSRSCLSLREDGSHADLIAHRHGVVLILSERLHLVTSQFDQLRAICFQDAINRAAPRRKLQRGVKSNSSKPLGSTQSGLEEQELPLEPLRLQQQHLDDETRALQVELTSLLDGVQETETKMVEVSALNHLMSTHILQQAQQIEYLYEQAIEATHNVEKGNKELSQAIERNRGSRAFLLLFLFVLTFSILFLDWYS